MEKKDLIECLTPLQYQVTQKDSTEAPFQNEYWDHKAPGIYVDIVSGEPLFASLHKYDSGSGWPSFFQPLEKNNIVEKSDHKLFMKRTEIRSKKADSHLGHVFGDGPPPTGLRYCINSAALRFIAVHELKGQGYGIYQQLFDDTATEKSGPTAETAILAGGCFWGVEELIRALPGVLQTTVGYTGGRSEQPTYDIVKQGTSGHAEAIQVIFDPTKLSYRDLLLYFFHLHDPTTPNQQGNDKGTQYRSAIFYLTQAQKATAHDVIKTLTQDKRWAKPVVTEVVNAQTFYPAEAYHQDYLQKNPRGYTCHYLRD